MDKYETAVKHLRQHREEMYAAWMRPWKHQAGCLFQACSPTGRVELLANGKVVGCPLMVAGGRYVAWTVDILRKVRKMQIPRHPDDLSDMDLVNLANLQASMDVTIRVMKWRLSHEARCIQPWPGDKKGGLDKCELSADEDE